MPKLTVGQFREALKMDKPVVRITAKQFKIKFEHYRPLHPVVIAAVRPLIEGRGDTECVFSYASFANFVRKDRNKILLSRINRLFVIDDLRKFTGQYGNVISWEQSNRSYILTHGVYIKWAHTTGIHYLNTSMMSTRSTGKACASFNNTYCASLNVQRPFFQQLFYPLCCRN